MQVFTWPWPEDSLVWVYLIPKFTYPLNNICFCSSVFLTVMIACERYLAVCHPISYRQMSMSNSNKQRWAWSKIKERWTQWTQNNIVLDAGEQIFWASFNIWINESQSISPDQYSFHVIGGKLWVKFFLLTEQTNKNVKKISPTMCTVEQNVCWVMVLFWGPILKPARSWFWGTKNFCTPWRRHSSSYYVFISGCVCILSPWFYLVLFSTFQNSSKQSSSVNRGKKHGGHGMVENVAEDIALWRT